MSRNQLNNSQNQMGDYQDPLTAANGNTAKKKVGGDTVAATVVSVLIFFLFGAVGGIICYGGYWAVRAILRSRMPLAARIILGIIVGLVFVVLFIAFFLFAAALRANI